jgi:hypothetical protein
MILTLALSFLGCGVADAEVQVPSAQTPAHPVLNWEELNALDVAGTDQAMGWVLQDIQALSPEQLAQTKAAMRELSVTCSYTRASHQIPLVLQPRIDALNPEHFAPAAHSDLAHLKHGVGDHVAVMDALGVELPMPEQGDFLFGHPNLVDRSGLAMMTAPLQNLNAQLDNIRTDFPPKTQDMVSANFELVESVTGHQSSFKAYTNGWYRGLKHVEPFAVNPQAKTEVNAMIELLTVYSESGC